MIQLMTFLIAQLMFVPVYLKVTDTCTENKGTFWQKIKIISISPFAVYLYVNIFFAFAMAFIPAPIAEICSSGLIFAHTLLWRMSISFASNRYQPFPSNLQSDPIGVHFCFFQL